MRKLRSNTDYPIGEELIYLSSTVKVVKDSGENECLRCKLFSWGICKNVYCMSRDRDDNQSIHFEEI